MAWLGGSIGPNSKHIRSWTLLADITQMIFSNLIPKSRGSKISKQLERTTTFHHLTTNNTLEEFHTRELQTIEAYVGSQMLRAMEDALQSKALAKSSPDRLIGLSILLFGELVSVGYSNTKPTIWDVRAYTILESRPLN